MSIAATYVSATQFTVATDKTSDFNPGRALRLDCGADGIKYGYVSYSSYSSPNTTVYLDSTESQAITSNLTACLFSRFKLERTGGNNPVELLWLMRGQQTIAVTYKDDDEITLKPGVVHLNDGTTEALYRCDGFDKQLTSLSASTWYYVYAQAPSTGRVLSADQITYSTTAPTLDGAKQGYYHPTETGKRCIGFVRSAGSSNIYEFSISQGRYYWRIQTSGCRDISGGTPSNTWTTYTFSSNPLPSMVVLVNFSVGYSNAVGTKVSCRSVGSSDNGWQVAMSPEVSGGAALTVYQVEIPTNSNKQTQLRFDSATTNLIYADTIGFLMPSELYSAAS